MKVGLSVYSLNQAIVDGRLDLLGAVRWTAEHGGEHIEIIGRYIEENAELIEKVKLEAEKLALPISSYTVGANFLTETVEEYEAEIDRIKGEVDLAAALGAKLMRHDAGHRPMEQATYAQFDEDLPRLVEACQRIADYAKTFGITTSVENHGFHVQNSERVQRLVNSVDRENFRTTLDIGNFLMVDEDPLTATINNLPIASLVHIKDMYVRQTLLPSENWRNTAHGRYFRPAIPGDGDLDMAAIFQAIKASGYDGYLSIEYEGWEDCLMGCDYGLKNIKRHRDAIL